MAENEIDYHEELNRLARDIRGCYCEQFKDRYEDSVYRCMRTIKEEEPLTTVEYFGSKFIVGACRTRDEKFVGDHENRYMIGRPRETSVTIGAELNEDGTVKKGEGAKCFVIFAYASEATGFEPDSVVIQPKTNIEVNFMERDPHKKSFRYPAFNVLENEAFLCNRFYADVKGKFFNVANRKNLALFAKEAKAKEEICDVIKNCVIPNDNDAQYLENVPEKRKLFGGDFLDIGAEIKDIKARRQKRSKQIRERLNELFGRKRTNSTEKGAENSEQKDTNENLSSSGKKFGLLKSHKENKGK